MMVAFDDLIDLRRDLARNPNGGPRQSVALASKQAAVFHYYGPPVPASETDEVAYFKGIANFHAFVRDWGSGARGDGIMYWLGIGRSGKRYLLREPQSVLWHCGTGLNATAFAVHCMLGGDQRATPAMLASLNRTGRELTAVYKVPRARFFGHVELGTTASCPGTIMHDWLLPYRAGEEPEEPDMADGRWFPPEETGAPVGYWLGGGFYQYWQTRGGLTEFGYPRTNEYDVPDPTAVTGLRTIQVFDKMALGFHPELEEPYRVQPINLGMMALESGLIPSPGG